MQYWLFGRNEKDLDLALYVNQEVQLIIWLTMKLCICNAAFKKISIKIIKPEMKDIFYSVRIHMHINIQLLFL